jgi:hypothetical protein
MAELAEPPLPSYYGLDLDFLLATIARRARLATSHIEPEDGRPAAGRPALALCMALGRVVEQQRRICRDRRRIPVCQVC